MKLKFLKEIALENLKNNISANIKNYSSDSNNWLKEEDFIHVKGEFPNFDLDCSNVENPEDTDFNNIKIIYSNMKHITDSQASDERLWAGLTHDRFWKYMQYRWPISKHQSKDTETFIRTRYFFGKDHPENHNGISRLWYIGRLTYDKDAKDPFELTRYLCKSLSGRGNTLFAVNYANNKRLMLVFLKTLKNYEEAHGNLTNEQYLRVKSTMVLWGGKLLLDSLSDEKIKEMILRHVKEILV